VSIALVAGLTLLTLAIGITLLQSPMRVIGSNGVTPDSEIIGTRHAATACQGHEVIPAGTSAISLALAAEIGPKVAVAVTSAKRSLTHGVRNAGWTGGTVTVPIQRVSRKTSDAEICFTVGPPLEELVIFGRYTRGAAGLTAGGQKLGGRMGVEYLRRESASWLSLAPSVARRMAFGRAWGGDWIAIVLLTAMLGSAALLSWLTLRELR
jgi:hypothetical protein